MWWGSAGGCWLDPSKGCGRQRWPDVSFSRPVRGIGSPVGEMALVAPLTGAIEGDRCVPAPSACSSSRPDRQSLGSSPASCGLEALRRPAERVDGHAGDVVERATGSLRVRCIEGLCAQCGACCLFGGGESFRLVAVRGADGRSRQSPQDPSRAMPLPESGQQRGQVAEGCQHMGGAASTRQPRVHDPCRRYESHGRRPAGAPPELHPRLAPHRGEQLPRRPARRCSDAPAPSSATPRLQDARRHGGRRWLPRMCRSPRPG